MCKRGGAQSWSIYIGGYLLWRPTAERPDSPQSKLPSRGERGEGLPKRDSRVQPPPRALSHTARIYVYIRTVWLCEPALAHSVTELHNDRVCANISLVASTAYTRLHTTLFVRPSPPDTRERGRGDRGFIAGSTSYARLANLYLFHWWSGLYSFYWRWIWKKCIYAICQLNIYCNGTHMATVGISIPKTHLLTLFQNTARFE